jgi:hypothetical protein
MILFALAIGLTSFQGGPQWDVNPPGALKDYVGLRRTAALVHEFDDLVAKGKFVEADHFLLANLIPKPPERSGYWLRGALLRYELQDFEAAFQRYVSYQTEFPREEGGNEMAYLSQDLIEAFILHARKGSPDRAVMAITDAYAVDVEKGISLIMGLGMQYAPRFARQIIACYRRLVPQSPLPEWYEGRLRERWGSLADGPWKSVPASRGLSMFICN